MLRPAHRLLRGQVGEWWASGHEEDLGYSEVTAEDEGFSLVPVLTWRGLALCGGRAMDPMTLGLN